MRWIIRNGVHFWLQPPGDCGLSHWNTVNWGKRSTARVFSSKAEAQVVVDAFLKAGWFRGYSLEVEELYPEYTDVPPDLLWRLRKCAECLLQLPQDPMQREFWRVVGLDAANVGYAHLAGSAPVTGDAIEIATELLQDLVECAEKLSKLLPLEVPVDPAGQRAIAEFASKTLALVNQVRGVRGDAA